MDLIIINEIKLLTILIRLAVLESPESIRRVRFYASDRWVILEEVLFTSTQPKFLKF